MRFEFDNTDTDSLVLADIRQLLFLIADNLAGFYKQGGADARFVRFVQERMTPDGDDE